MRTQSVTKETIMHHKYIKDRVKAILHYPSNPFVQYCFKLHPKNITGLPICICNSAPTQNDKQNSTCNDS